MGCCASCCTSENRGPNHALFRSPQPRHSRSNSPQIAPIRSNVIFVQEYQPPQFQREPSGELAPQVPHRNSNSQSQFGASNGAGAASPLRQTPSDITLHTVPSLTASTATTNSSLKQQPLNYHRTSLSSQQATPQAAQLQRRVSFDLRPPASKGLGESPTSRGVGVLERPSVPSPLRPPSRQDEKETITEHSWIITDY